MVCEVSFGPPTEVILLAFGRGGQVPGFCRKWTHRRSTLPMGAILYGLADGVSESSHTMHAHILQPLQLPQKPKIAPSMSKNPKVAEYWDGNSISGERAREVLLLL